MITASILQGCSIAAAILSAATWLRGATVKVTREQMVQKRVRKAAAQGLKANLAGAVLDGWDMSETFRAQSSWNAFGASFAGVSVILQSIAPYFPAG